MGQDRAPAQGMAQAQGMGTGTGNGHGHREWAQGIVPRSSPFGQHGLAEPAVAADAAR